MKDWTEKWEKKNIIIFGVEENNKGTDKISNRNKDATRPTLIELKDWTNIWKPVRNFVSTNIFISEDYRKKIQ